MRRLSTAALRCETARGERSFQQPDASGVQPKLADAVRPCPCELFLHAQDAHELLNYLLNEMADILEKRHKKAREDQCARHSAVAAPAVACMPYIAAHAKLVRICSFVLPSCVTALLLITRSLPSHGSRAAGDGEGSGVCASSDKGASPDLKGRISATLTRGTPHNEKEENDKTCGEDLEEQPDGSEDDCIEDLK